MMEAAVTRARIALVGLGAIGTSAHLPALLRSSTVELAAVADAEAARRSNPRVPAGVAIVDSLDALLSDQAIQGVVLATPPWITPGLAIDATRAGRFVLAEKPVAVNPAAARAYDQLSDAERARVQVGLTYRHDPAMQRLRSLIRDGGLGSPLLVRAHIYDETRTPDMAHTELIERTLEHGMPVVHEGAHALDWLHFLLDAEPVIADAWSLRTRDGLAADNLVGARLGYGPHTAVLEFGWFTDGLPRTELTVTGDLGTAVLDGRTFDIELITSRGVENLAFEGDRVARCFDLQLDRFAALIAGGRAEPDLGDGIRALEWSAAIARRAEGAR
jgi:myo-inositol 2-dehydrogenase/D-chiro-inositol 1-dehydrogenase